ncbi:MAG: hypothetical protein ACQETZ_11415 [Candidatus Fermentibacterota bacterium]
MPAESSDGGRRGAVLVVVFVVTIALAVLVGAVWTLFYSNTESFQYARDRTAALYAAESGARLAVHHLSEATSMPEGTEPFHMPGDSSGWIALPGMEGRALVVIDPSNDLSGAQSIGGVEIRSRGSCHGYTRDVAVHYFPDYPSRYALLVDESIPRGFLEDGTEIEGPVHCNGAVSLSSASPDSSGDPFVWELSTTAEGGFRFSDVGFATVPHPRGSSVWVRPYRRHASGPPAWDPSADSVDFDRLKSYFRSLQGEAMRMGTLVQGGGRAILRGDTLLMREANMGPVRSLELERGQDLVYFQNGAIPLYIKCGRPCSRPLTIVAEGDVYIYGNMHGSPAVVSLGDIVVPTDPALVGEPDWSPPWNISTDGNMLVEAFLAAPAGELRSESVRYPPGTMTFRVFGGVLEKSMGRLGSSYSGHQLEIDYDAGMSTAPPPHFPILENWKMSSWTEDPGYEEAEMEEDLY